MSESIAAEDCLLSQKWIVQMFEAYLKHGCNLLEMLMFAYEP